MSDIFELINQNCWNAMPHIITGFIFSSIIVVGLLTWTSNIFITKVKFETVFLLSMCIFAGWNMLFGSSLNDNHRINIVLSTLLAIVLIVTLGDKYNMKKW